MQKPQANNSLGVIYEREHFVQFYPRDEMLINNLRTYIGAGLKAGDSCIVICTAAHRQMLEDLLRSGGYLTADTESYVCIDADELLARFVSNGKVDRDAFRRVIGALLAESRSEGKQVRAFGEMVAQLWINGFEAAAMRLETLWNEIASEYQLTLFCAYPMHSFDCSDNFHATTEELRSLHSSIITA